MLILPIKSKWFNMILSGDKQEEYREIKPYYTTRFKKIFEMYPNSNIPTGLDKQLIGFRNGYGSSRPQFTAVCSLDIKTGKQEKEDIKAMEDELCLLTYAVLACLKGLKEQGCNGPVTEAIGKIEKHINQKAHGQET